ncbi:MAG: hypothetical protein EOO51_08530 [Flavobacterium sp.]|nr:MAG: hypothetical protein EOO51_08530 [Flavobacterium sp.]
MKFNYNQKMQTRLLIFSILYLLIGIVGYVFTSVNLGAFIGIGILYLVTFLLQNRRPYVEITDEQVIVGSLARKKISFNEVKEFKYFAGDYIIKSHSGKELTIDTNVVDKKNLPELERLLKQKLGESNKIKPAVVE